MCGIYANTESINDNLIRKKLEIISHRGPDFSDFIKTKDCIMGHTRLSIIDLDPRSNQPFLYKNLVIIFNGEIYNFKSLKKDLQKDGLDFCTQSDTEVLAAMYIRYGVNMLSMLNGMFSFCILDKSEDILFFARDRTGKKPLYYKLSGPNIEIASQVNQIRIGSNLSIDNKSVQAFFKYKYIPEPRSIYKDVSKLPAGHYGIYNLKSRKASIEKYWDIDNNKDQGFGDYAEAKHYLKETLTSAVKIRLIADVPVGVFLSGGIDSSLVAAIAHSQSNESIKTFTIRFKDQAFDESASATKVADYIGTKHTTIDCETNDLLEMISSFGRTFDEPFADSSALPSMLLSQKAKEHITVALSGDGADEVFLGYNRYDQLQKYRHIFKIPAFLRGNISSLLRHLNQTKLANVFNLKDEEHFYHYFVQGFNQKYFNGNQSDILIDHFKYLSKSDDLIANAGFFDMKTYLPDDINVKVDRSSMFASLEARSPFLDYRVIDIGTNLPQKYKYDGKTKKKIIRDIAFDFIPANILEKPKSGFTIPLASWFRGELKELIFDNLTTKNLEDIPGINSNEAVKIIKMHMSGKENRQNEIWKLLVMSIWLKNTHNVYK